MRKFLSLCFYYPGHWVSLFLNTDFVDKRDWLCYPVYKIYSWLMKVSFRIDKNCEVWKEPYENETNDT